MGKIECVVIETIRDSSITYLALKNPTYVKKFQIEKIQCVIIETMRDSSITYLALKYPTYAK